MAARWDAVGDELTRTTNLPTIGSFSLMGFFRLTADRNAHTRFLAFGSNTGFERAYIIGTNADGTTLFVDNGDSGATGVTLVVGTWYHAGITVAGNGAGQFLAYLDGALAITHDGEPAAIVSAEEFWIGNDQFGNFLDGRAAGVKFYDAVLTAAEMKQESMQIAPVRTANLNSFYPIKNAGEAATDYSGNGRTMTVGGTLSTEDGPPVPWVNTYREFRRRQHRPAPFKPGIAR